MPAKNSTHRSLSPSSFYYDNLGPFDLRKQCYDAVLEKLDTMTKEHIYLKWLLRRYYPKTRERFEHDLRKYLSDYRIDKLWGMLVQEMEAILGREKRKKEDKMKKPEKSKKENRRSPKKSRRHCPSVASEESRSSIRLLDIYTESDDEATRENAEAEIKKTTPRRSEKKSRNSPRNLKRDCASVASIESSSSVDPLDLILREAEDYRETTKKERKKSKRGTTVENLWMNDDRERTPFVMSEETKSPNQPFMDLSMSSDDAILDYSTVESPQSPEPTFDEMLRTVSSPESPQSPEPTLNNTTLTVTTSFGEFPAYPLPNFEMFKFEPTSGYFYDKTTEFYYDKRTGYYFDCKSQEWLFYSTTFGCYIPCRGGDEVEKKRLMYEEVKNVLI